ncbi:MAG: hypothetical protein WC839_00225 [Candidatus Paceibacterota bacterium]
MKNVLYVINHVEIIFCFNLVFSFLGIIILKKRRIYKNYASYIILTRLIIILIFINFIIIFTHIEVSNQIGEKMHLLNSILGSIKIEFFGFLMSFILLISFIEIFYKPEDSFYIKFLVIMFAVFFVSTAIITIVLYVLNILVPT